MALIRLGQMVGQASGSLGATVYSYNRYGTYVRMRAKPVSNSSPYAALQRSILGLSSQLWRSLTANQQQAWVTWAQTNPITNRLGDKQILDGHTACTMLNANLLTIGASTIDAPPVADAPQGLETLTFSADIGAGDFEINFTPTPIGTNNQLQIWAAVMPNNGIKFVRNRYKLVQVSAANAATGIDFLSDLTTRWGTIQAGQVVHLKVNVISNLTGLSSAPYPIVETVVST